MVSTATTTDAPVLDGPSDGQSNRRRVHPDTTSAQVFARDTRLPLGSPLVHLERGQADAVRGAVRAGHLVCPIAGCPDPSFVVRGKTRRDHFAHRPGAVRHAPETIAHHTAKNLIGAWLRTELPGAVVHVDDQDIENGQRPDVLLTLPGGRRFAYEVQFAHLTPDDWQHRHDGYAAAGIRDVWLFGGHRYDHPTRAKHRLDGEVHLHSIFASVLATGHPMLLINPAEQTVALGAGPGVEEHLAARGVAPPTGWHHAHVHQRWVLDQLRAPGGVIDVPGTRRQLERAAADHADWATRAAARRAEQAAAERAFAEAQARRELVLAGARNLAAHMAERELQWADERAAAEAAYGRLPSVVDATGTEAELTLRTAPSQWRWRVLHALCQEGTAHTDASTLVHLMEPTSGTTQGTHELLTTYLRTLRRAGWVWFWGVHTPDKEPVHPLTRVGQRPAAEPTAKALQPRGRSGRVKGPPPQRHSPTPARASAKAASGTGRGTPALAVRRQAAASMQAPPRTSWQPSLLPGRTPPARLRRRADVIDQHPEYAQWAATQDWAWLQAAVEHHLLNDARLLVYLACHLSQSGPVHTLHLTDVSDDDFHTLLGALQRAGYLDVEEYAAGHRRWRAH
ncbi:competence protein CoiA family protein [Cellulomonas aerilata]|nr:competence protein CoiA family protein [Cellulomonas aerilata]